jgi:hypothetical protein
VLAVEHHRLAVAAPGHGATARDEGMLAAGNPRCGGHGTGPILPVPARKGCVLASSIG